MWTFLAEAWMCGIVAGRYDDPDDSQNGFRFDHATGLVDLLLAGPRRLEHRGYDSAGPATWPSPSPSSETAPAPSPTRWS